jgi:ribosomal protein S18 acetylase RimI-like enzyme
VGSKGARVAARWIGRAATPDDAAWLLALYATTRQAEVALLGLDPAATEAFVRFQYQAQCASWAVTHPSATTEVVVDDGRPVGRLVVDRSGARTVLVDVTLAPEVQGRGLGTALVAALLAEAREQQRSVELHVATGSRARSLYERLGFLETATDGMYDAMRWDPQP